MARFRTDPQVTIHVNQYPVLQVSNSKATEQEVDVWKRFNADAGMKRVTGKQAMRIHAEVVRTITSYVKKDRSSLWLFT